MNVLRLVENHTIIHKKRELIPTILVYNRVMVHEDFYQLMESMDNEPLSKKPEILILYAARYGTLEIVRDMIQKGADIHVRNENGETALMWAVVEGNLDIVIYLIEQGADIKAKTHTGESVLTWAVLGGNKEIFKLLKQAGAEE